MVIFFSFKIEIIVFNDRKEIDRRDKRTGGGYLIKRGSIITCLEMLRYAKERNKKRVFVIGRHEIISWIFNRKKRKKNGELFVRVKIKKRCIEMEDSLEER